MASSRWSRRHRPTSPVPAAARPGSPEPALQARDLDRPPPQARARAALRPALPQARSGRRSSPAKLIAARRARAAPAAASKLAAVAAPSSIFSGRSPQVRRRPELLPRQIRPPPSHSGEQGLLPRTSFCVRARSRSAATVTLGVDLDFSLSLHIFLHCSSHHNFAPVTSI